ncbi:MAG: site-specific DNA-methyltransferase, partial [Oligoflexia bacterium]|nr:site-specific DNA-methyltransferase [Oligoflexia bacterium]
IMTHDHINNKIDKVFLVDKPNKHEKGSFNQHKTVKPLSLFKYLIKLTTKKGSLVLDPFMGSGTTALACKELERQFIGVEINKQYIETAIKRLKRKKTETEPMELTSFVEQTSV